MSDQVQSAQRCEALFSSFLASAGPGLPATGALAFPGSGASSAIEPAALAALASAINAMTSSPRSERAVDSDAVEDDPDCVVQSNWWGLDMIMSESLTNKIAIGTGASGSVAVIIGASFAGVGAIAGALIGPLAGGFAAALALKSGEIKLIDNGNGVHFPISWPQLGLVIAGVSAGPAGVIAAIMAFIHPVAR